MGKTFQISDRTKEKVKNAFFKKYNIDYIKFKDSFENEAKILEMAMDSASAELDEIRRGFIV